VLNNSTDPIVFASDSEFYSNNLKIFDEIELLKKCRKNSNLSACIDYYHNNENLSNQKKEPNKYNEEFDKFIENIDNQSLFGPKQITTGNEEKKFFINLDKEDFRYWELFFYNFFNLNKFSGYFVFYYNDVECKNNIEIKKRNYNRKSFSHSKFLRDYLKARNLMVEVSIQNLSGLILSDLKTDEIKPKEDFKNVFNKINGSLAKLFPGVQVNEIFPQNGLELIYYYQYNKSKFEDSKGLSNTEFFKKQFPYLSLKNTHENLRAIDQLFSESNELKDEVFNKIGKFEYLNHFRKALSSFINAAIKFKEFSPIFIFWDDHREYLNNKLDVIKIWFMNCKIYAVKPSNYEEINSSLKELKSGGNFELNLSEFKGNEKWDEVNTKTLSEINKNDNPVFIFIDLDFEGINLGFNLLRNIKFYVTHKQLKNVFPVVFSRYEDPYHIRTSVNSGAIFYINKLKFYRVIFKIFEMDFERTNNKQDGNTHQSWSILNKIEPAKVLELKNIILKGENVTTEKDNNYSLKLEKDIEYRWINKFPKADLHTHIGTIFGSDIIPLTSLLVLCELFENKKLSEGTIQSIIQFLIPIAFDPNLNEQQKKNTDLFNNYKLTFANKKNTKEKSIFEILVNKPYDLINNKILPEAALLDPEDTTLERLIKKEKLSDPYFENKLLLRKNKEANYDVIMLFFIILINFRNEQKYSLPIENNLNGGFSLKYFLEKELNQIDPSVKKDLTAIKEFEKKIKDYLNEILNNNYNKFNIHENLDDSDPLKFLQSARSNQRCLGENRSLFNYLRGCEYGGAPHLQTKTSIYLITRYIICNYAIPNNIRYIGLRCAVDGYSKLGLQSQEEAMEALLRGVDYYSQLEYNKKEQERKKAHVDVIITAKRHKSIPEFENNVKLALKYRHGLNLNKNKDKSGSFFQQNSRVVSFDLAGIEFGYRVENFLNQFQPLLKKSFPITIHAGEEDTYESVWQAIYLVNSHRIGHALTLRNDRNLLEMVRDRHIAIELCPFSNYMTRKNKRYNINPNEKKSNWEKEKFYPLKQCLKEQINVTINIDNPVVSDSTLNEEFLFAAKLSNGLSKWEILKIIKNGFKHISCSLEDKRILMNEIEDEIYEILLNEEYEY